MVTIGRTASRCSAELSSAGSQTLAVKMVMKPSLFMSIATARTYRTTWHGSAVIPSKHRKQPQTRLPQYRMPAKQQRAGTFTGRLLHWHQVQAAAQYT